MTERKTIYLDDALEAIRKLPNAGIHWLVSAEAVFDVLLKLPSAQPERKRGKWNVYYHGGSDFSYSCHECGYPAPYDLKGGKAFQKKWAFCPGCGADMMGGEQDG